jgi:hypothetical protein
MHERPRVLDGLGPDDHVLGCLAAQHHAREAGDDRRNRVDDVLGERVLEEYEAESARWATSAEQLRRETVASILAGEAVDVQRASSVLRHRSR